MEKLSLTGQSKHSTDSSLRGLSALFVDGEDVYVDNGAIHGKSQLERSLTFTRSLEELHPTREVWVIWLTLRRGEDGQQGFAGAQPFRIWVDAQQRLGYKSLSEQVNRMDRAVKGQVDLTAVPAPVRQRAAAYLRQVRPDLWERASAAFREGWEA